MSNPFRKKINADPQRSLPDNPGTGTSQSLSINTGAKAEKHVRIASPPDTAISPASYPSSPEFARLTPSPQQTIVPYNFNASLHSPVGDRFAAADYSEDEDDGVASEALKNTRLNIASTRALPVEASNKQEDAVQNTLSKFASRPRDGKAPTTQSAAEASKQDTKTQTMDVNAFTRLLLTGGDGSSQNTSGPSSVIVAGPPNVSESSSTADSASISHQSIFEPMPPIVADSPRTSHELDEAESATTRRSVTSGDSTKKPPPAPRPRHGKPIKQPAPLETMRQIPHIPTAAPISPEPISPESDLNKPLPPPPALVSDSSKRGSATSIVGTNPPMQIKRPPTPPLTRRRSQGPNKPPLSRSSPSFQSHIAISQFPSSSSSLSQASKAPPPPPSRRASQRLIETTNIPSLPSTSKETNSADLSKPILPQLSRTTSTAKRASIMSENTPPPLPPPRKHRGSSNASQRPNLGMTGSVVAGSNRSSIEGQRPGVEATERIVEGSGRDILRDLASLQAEIDALKRQGLN